MSTETETEQPQSFSEYKANRAASPEPVVADEPAAEPEQKVEEEKPARKPKLEQRFSELTQARRAAEEKAAAAEARAEAAEAKAREVEGKSAPQVAIDPDDVGPKPKPADYTDAFEYAEDLAKWSTDKALKDRDIREAKAKEESARGEVLKAWQTRLDNTKAEIPDFEEMVTSSELSVSDVVRDTIIESEFGPKLLYHFASDDDAAQKLNGMTVKQALMHIAKLEAKYESAAEKASEVREEKPRMRLPTPITAIKSGTTAGNPVTAPGEFSGSYSQWKALRKSGRA